MRAAAFACVVLLVASPALAAKLNLPGQVTYRERVALPATARLRIQLVDESLPSAPPRLDVEAQIGPGQVPLSFNLTFEDAIIVPDHSYALIAAITAGGALMFRNFEPYAVNPLAPAEPIVIVTNMVAVATPPATANVEPAVPPPPAILDRTWTATTIGDQPALPRHAPSLTIGEDRRAGGSGGCNSWFAEAQLDGDTLRFGGITSTRRTCGETVDALEQAFFTALAAAARWEFSGDVLTLYGSDGQPRLAFAR